MYTEPGSYVANTWKQHHRRSKFNLITAVNFKLTVELAGTSVSPDASQV